MASAFLPDGYRYLKKDELIQKGDLCWSQSSGIWAEVVYSIGCPPDVLIAIRKIDSYLPKTESETW